MENGSSGTVIRKKAVRVIVSVFTGGNVVKVCLPRERDRAPGCATVGADDQSERGELCVGTSWVRVPRTEHHPVRHGEAHSVLLVTPDWPLQQGSGCITACGEAINARVRGYEQVAVLSVDSESVNVTHRQFTFLRICGGLRSDE